MFQSFRDMQVWQAAMEIAEKVHTLTDSLPRKEDYGFTSQVRRSALSISANIAEGFGRKHVPDKINFYLYSRGSLTETQSHIEYGLRVGYIKAEDAVFLDTQLSSLHHDLNKLISGITSRSSLKTKG
ncbi:MAG: four helix bundle protein [Desulfuromonadaceae bacterium]|nr:four helix bundle protein [Desulfuromonadaceae bacterium]